MACSPIYFKRAAETLPAQSSLTLDVGRWTLDGTNRQFNPSHTPGHTLGENHGLNALVKLLKVMDIPRSELDCVLQPFWELAHDGLLARYEVVLPIVMLEMMILRIFRIHSLKT